MQHREGEIIVPEVEEKEQEQRLGRNLGEVGRLPKREQRDDGVKG